MANIWRGQPKSICRNVSILVSKNSLTQDHPPSLFLPKDYPGSPTSSLYTPWTEAEVHSHLATGWGEGRCYDWVKAGVSLRAKPPNYVPLSNRVSGTGIFIFRAWYGILWEFGGTWKGCNHRVNYAFCRDWYRTVNVSCWVNAWRHLLQAEQ